MKALIVIDMQKDFIDGALGTEEAVEIVPNVRKKIVEYHKNGDTVIFTRDTHHEDYLTTHEGKYLPVTHCIKGTEGWEIDKTVDVERFIHIDKTSFGFTGWNHVFDGENVESIEIVGLCTDICVISNALILRALFPEIEIVVDSSCCAGVTKETHKAALDVMKCCHIKVTGE